MTTGAKIQAGVLAAILLLAAGLRLHGIGAQSFWLDELLSLEASTGRGQTDQELTHGEIITPERLTKLEHAPPAWRVWTTLHKDSHPPLYYVLLRGWRVISGDGEGAVRAMSVLWSLIAVGMIYLVGTQISGRWAGLIAAGLMAISPLQVVYAQEARSYAMLCATTLFVGWAYLRAEEKDSNARLVVLAAALVVAMLTHYLAAPVLAGIGLYAAARCRGKKLARIGAAFAIAAVVYAIVWGPFVMQQRESFQRNREGAADREAPGSLMRTLVRAGCEPIRQIGGRSVAGLSGAPVAAALVAVAWIFSIIALRRNKAVLAHLWLGCPLLFLGLVDVLADDATLRLTRYTIVCAPGLFLQMGCLACGQGERWKNAVWSGLAVIAAVYSVWSLPAAYQPWKADWRGLAAGLDQKLQSGDVVVLATNEPQAWWLGGAVLGITHYSSQGALPMLLVERPASEAALKTLSRGWMVEYGVATPPEEMLPGVRAIQVGVDPQMGNIYRIESARR